MRKLLLPFFLFLLAANVTSAQLPATANLIGWWPFCNDTLDHSGHGFHLINNNVTITTDRFGNANSAFAFNGVNSGMRYSPFFSSTDFTYACWINAVALQSSVILYNGNPNLDGFGIVMNNGTGTIPAPAGNNVGVLFAGVGQFLSTPVTLSQWHHLVLTKNGSNYQLYIDTISIGTFSGVFNPLTNLFTVGIDNTDGSDPFNGKIDDVVAYDRALTLAEIKSLYHYTARTPVVNLGPNVASCAGAPVTLAPIGGSYVSPTYLWGGPAPVGGVITPTVSAVSTGDYWVQVTDEGCVGADTLHADIVYDTFTLITPNSARCKGQPILAVATNGPGISYLWTPTTGVSSPTSPSTNITADTSAWYTITGTIGGCVVKDSFFLDVQPNPIVYAGGNRDVCENDTLRLNPSVTPAWYTGYIFDWTPGTRLDDSTARNVVYTSGSTNTKLVLKVTTPAGCIGSDSLQIIAHRGNFLASPSNMGVCPNDSAQIILNSSEPTANYHWFPSTYLSDTTTDRPWVHPITTQTYSIIGTTSWGCTDTASVTISVFPGATISMPDSVVLHPGDSYHISPSTNGTSFVWSPVGGLSNPYVSDPLATPASNTQYSVLVKTENNCMTRDTIDFILNPETLIVLPNAFTPGGGNGLNNMLYAIRTGPAELRYLRIYNRWGNKVFESNSVSKGWDGSYRGDPQPFGVYVYELEAVTDNGILFKKQGNITLIR